MWSEGGWTGPNYKVAYAIGDSPFRSFKRLGQFWRRINSKRSRTSLGNKSAEERRLVYHLSQKTTYRKRRKCTLYLHRENVL